MSTQTTGASAPSAAMVGDLAEAIVRVVSERMPAGERPTIEFIDGVDASAMGGGGTIAIKYKTTTYKLELTIATGNYKFILTETKDSGQPKELGKFDFKASDSWSASIGLPAIKITDTVSIEEVSISVTATPVTG